MAEELVTIAYEFSPLKANLMRTRLEADGIECFLRGETLASVGANMYAISWDHPHGDIAVQVRESDVWQAREIFREIEAAPRDEEDENWMHAMPNHAAGLLRVLVIGALVIYATVWTYDTFQNWWLGGLVGASTLTGLYFIGFKNSFKWKS